MSSVAPWTQVYAAYDTFQRQIKHDEGDLEFAERVDGTR